jgi:hypothetical protein
MCRERWEKGNKKDMERELITRQRVPSLQTLALLELLTPETQMQLFEHLEHRGADRPNSLQKRLADIESKYCTLVWYARRDLDGATPAYRQFVNEKVAEYVTGCSVRTCQR